MILLAVIRRHPFVAVPACAVALALVLISEIAYRQAAGSLDTLHRAEVRMTESAALPLGLGEQTVRQEARALAASREDLHRVWKLARLGSAVLSGLGLLALLLYLRQTVVHEDQQDAQVRHMHADHDRLDTEVRRRTAQLTELAHHLQTAREDERSRLARDLHDELGALLTSAKLDAARLRPRLVGAAPEVHERLAHLVSMLDSSIALGRRIVEDLMPSTLAHLGLAATLDILMREFAERSGLVVHSTLMPVPLAAGAELTVYRLVQEATTNIGKHAGARHVWLSLSAETPDGLVEVSVRDDGCGFDSTGAGGATPGHGLVGMRFRVEAEQGVLTVQSSPGQGTLVCARLPRRRRPT